MIELSISWDRLNDYCNKIKFLHCTVYYNRKRKAVEGGNENHGPGKLVALDCVVRKMYPLSYCHHNIYGGSAHS
jgi:hypothetical protein